MPMFQCTWFFENTLTNVGWSEPYLVQESDYVPAQAVMDTLNPLRLACMTSNNYIRSLRVSNIALRGDALVANYGNAAVGGIDPTAHPDAGPFDACLLRKDTDPPIYHGFLYLRGIPEDTFVGRQLKANGFIELGPLPDFIAGILAGPFFFRHLQQGHPVSDATYPAITAMSGVRRVSRRIGRPFDQLRGRRRIA